jgi:hypothetical protein
MSIHKPITTPLPKECINQEPPPPPLDPTILKNVLAIFLYVAMTRAYCLTRPGADIKEITKEIKKDLEKINQGSSNLPDVDSLISKITKLSQPQITGLVGTASLLTDMESTQTLVNGHLKKWASHQHPTVAELHAALFS